MRRHGASSDELKGWFMKRSWFAFAAASVLSLNAPASATEFSFNWGGHGTLSGYGIDQDEVPTNDIQGFGFAAEGKVWANPKFITDNGIEFGLRAQVRLQSSEHEFSNDFIRGAPDWVDEVWIYAQTAFGLVTLGLEDGAADSAGIYAPVVSRMNNIDDARAYPLQDPLQSSFAPYMPNGAHMRTDLNASGDAFKIIYTSPRLIGLQLTGSYAPELTRGLNDIFDDNDQFDEQSDIWEVGLNYQGSLSSFDVGFYAGFASGTNERPTPNHTVPVVARALIGNAITTFNSVAFTPDDLQEWGAGAQVGWEGFKVGGSYRETNIAGAAGLADLALGPSLSVGCSQVAGCVLPDSQTVVWSAGLTYETGPWNFGVNYVNLEEELPPFDDGLVRRALTQDAQGYMGAVGYVFDDNLQITVGYQHYDFDGPTGSCVAAACDTLEADLGFIETIISF